jgi:hypothetical protein
MLSKPRYGWTNVTIGDFSERASYLTDVPIQCLQSFVSMLKYKLPFAVNFDAEGWEYVVVITDFEAHILSNKCDNGHFYKWIDIRKEDLAKELISDIENHFDCWVDWMCDEYMSEESWNKRVAQIRFLLDELKGAIT